MGPVQPASSGPLTRSPVYNDIRSIVLNEDTSDSVGNES